MKIVITGGHHTSALPVIALLQKNHPEIEISWFGHKHTSQGDKNPTLEYMDITALNLTFYSLIAGKFYKTYNLVRLFKIPIGFVHSLILLLKVRPDLIVSFGGYLAVPVVVVGWLLGIPSITHEQTTVVGWANKVISKFAKKVLITWPNSSKYFDSSKIVKTGLPLRQEIFSRNGARFVLNNTLHTVYVTAGKTGSHKINLVIGEALEHLLQFCNVIHQCGNNSVFKDFEWLQTRYENLAKTESYGSYIVKKFVQSDEIGEVLAKSDLLVSRGGAHTCVEIAALKKPALIIPIPWVSHNEQFENAKLLKEAGIAEILVESDMNSESLVHHVKNMLTNINKYVVVDSFQLGYSSPDSAQLIINEILKFEKIN